jgi:ABC-type polysaccharide/polyol phosphate export permease
MNLQVTRAWRDLVNSLGSWQLWFYVGLQDIRLRYRRSAIGPFWITLSLAVTIVPVGIFYSSIFQSTVHVYLPYFAMGFILWAYITSLVVEGCLVFIQDGSYIRQLPAPLLTYLFKATWRAIIIFAHNFVIFVAVALYFQIWAGWGYLEAALGFVLLTINGMWMMLFLGTVCGRYRDIPPIVQSAVSVLFFITPVLWERQAAKQYSLFVDLNPFYHLIEVVRAPLLGDPVPPLSWLVVSVMALAGSSLTFLFFSRYRRRIAYWV